MILDESLSSSIRRSPKNWNTGMDMIACILLSYISRTLDCLFCPAEKWINLNHGSAFPSLSLKLESLGYSNNRRPLMRPVYLKLKSIQKFARSRDSTNTYNFIASSTSKQNQFICEKQSELLCKRNYPMCKYIESLTCQSITPIFGW